MHVVNGLGERESFRPGDYMAYYRQLRQRFLDAVAARFAAFMVLGETHRPQREGSR